MKRTNKKAATLIELILAIAIMGSLGGLVSSFLGKVYENYAIQKELSKLEFYSIQILSQLDNYLKRSVPNSIMQHNGTKVGGVFDVYNANAYTPIRSITNGDLLNERTLIWTDIDKESLQGTGPQPYYNQWLNIRTSGGNPTIIQSVDSSFNNIKTTQENVMGTNPITPAIYFVYGNQRGTPYEMFYNTTNITDSNGIFAIDTGVAMNANDFQLQRIPDEIGEIFYMSGTAYGLKLVNKTLKLIYNFQPWEKLGTGNGETFINGTEEDLLENVTSFRYWVEYDTLRIEICVDSDMVVSYDGAGNPEYLNLCKERTIGTI